MKERLYQAPIRVKKSPIQGYGVFADIDFKKGDLIEECHIIYTEDVHSTIFDYVFDTSFKSKKALALGFGGIYNHAQDFNTKWHVDEIDHLLVLNAAREIRKGEEILISYGEKYFSSRNMRPYYPFKYKLRKLFSPMRRRVALMLIFILCLAQFLSH